MKFFRYFWSDFAGIGRYLGWFCRAVWREAPTLLALLLWALLLATIWLVGCGLFIEAVR